MSVCMKIYVNEEMYESKYVCMNICMQQNIRIFVCRKICKHACEYVSICMCACTYTLFTNYNHQIHNYIHLSQCQKYWVSSLLQRTNFTQNNSKQRNSQFWRYGILAKGSNGVSWIKGGSNGSQSRVKGKSTFDLIDTLLISLDSYHFSFCFIFTFIDFLDLLESPLNHLTYIWHTLGSQITLFIAIYFHWELVSGRKTQTILIL